jgi:uncharacterized membrane protein YdbT with pleckstrin-like domain
MGYVADSLATNEKVIGQATFHWSYKLMAWLALIFLGVFIIGIWIFFAMMIKVWTTEIAVTNQRLVYKTGWLRLDTSEMALPNIEGVRVTQGFWGRIFGYGHVRIEGTGVDAIETPPIGHPVAFRKAIENAKFNSVGGSGPKRDSGPVSHITPS